MSLLYKLVDEINELLADNELMRQEIAELKARNVGANRPNRKKLSPREVVMIREYHCSGLMSQRELADTYLVNPSTISRILSGMYHQ